MADEFNKIMVLIEKITAASPTLIFDFLIFDIRQWNLTGHHLIQDDRQQQPDRNAVEAANKNLVTATQKARLETWLKNNPEPPIWDLFGYANWILRLKDITEAIRATP